MSFDVFLSFDGNCKEALDFYSKVFKAAIQGLMTYGDVPEDPDFPISEKDKNLIMYSEILIFGSNMMFCDVPENSGHKTGNNVSLTLGTKNKDEITRIFNELSEDGTIDMELQSTFWSDWFGSVQDKFGIIWQLSHDSEKKY